MREKKKNSLSRTCCRRLGSFKGKKGEMKA